MQFVLPYSGLQWSDLWFMLQGAANTLLVTVLAGIAGTLLGCIIGWARDTLSIARVALAPYVDVTRSVPLIIQFILMDSFLSIMGHPLDPFWLGTIALSLYMGVLTSELVRSGLSSVSSEVRRAGRSLGFTYWQELRHISAPVPTNN